MTTADAAQISDDRLQEMLAAISAPNVGAVRLSGADLTDMRVALTALNEARRALDAVLRWYGGPTDHPEDWSECMVAAASALAAINAIGRK